MIEYFSDYLTAPFSWICIIYYRNRCEGDYERWAGSIL